MTDTPEATEPPELESKAIIMEVWAKDRDDLIATFRWSSENGGATTITFAKEDFGTSLQKFIDNGLSEWIGPPEDQKPRVTFSKDAYFLPNLAAYIRQTNGMRVSLGWEGRVEQ